MESFIFYATITTLDRDYTTRNNKLVKAGSVRLLEPVGGTAPYSTVFQNVQICSHEKYPDNQLCIVRAVREADYEGKPSYKYRIMSTTDDFLKINDIVSNTNLTIVHGVEELIEDPV